LELDPRHERVHNFGFTFSKGIGDFIVRGEFVDTANRYFNSKDPTQDHGLVRGNQISYVLGLDTSLAGLIDVSTEFQQRILAKSMDVLSDERILSWIFFRAETGFLKQTLIPQIVVIVGLDRGDVQFSPRLTYKVRPNLSLSWGMDLFTGPMTTLYGEFTHSDRVYMTTSWKF
jgi:hypothetical protein